MRADGLIRLLENKSIRFTQPEFLNDPYECHVTLDTNARQKLVSDFYAYLIEKEPSKEKCHLQERAEANEPSLVEMALKQFRTLRSELGVLSLTESPMNLLMWAHYGDEHRGAVVEIDIQHHSLFKPSKDDTEFSGFFAVNYSAEKIAGIPNRETVIDSLLTKSTDWQYENEWRFIRTTNLLRHAKDQIYVADIDPAVIKQVIFGARFPDELLESAATKLKSETFKHVEVNKAVMNPHKFGMRIVKASDFGWMQLHRSHHFGEFAKEAMLVIPMLEDENQYGVSLDHISGGHSG